jgi:hypothetical protein
MMIKSIKKPKGHSLGLYGYTQVGAIIVPNHCNHHPSPIQTVLSVPDSHRILPYKRLADLKKNLITAGREFHPALKERL